MRMGGSFAPVPPAARIPRRITRFKSAVPEMVELALRRPLQTPPETLGNAIDEPAIGERARRRFPAGLTRIIVGRRMTPVHSGIMMGSAISAGIAARTVKTGFAHTAVSSISGSARGLPLREGLAFGALDAPLDVELVVFEGLLGGEVAALGLIVDNAVDNLPVMLASGGLPAAQVFAVEQRDPGVVGWFPAGDGGLDKQRNEHQCGQSFHGIDLLNVGRIHPMNGGTGRFCRTNGK